MRPRIISTFWIGYCLGLLCLSPAWAVRDEPRTEPHSADELPMKDWLHLPEATRARIVNEYAPGRRTEKGLFTNG
jgi:hypothetical protein